MYEDGCDNKLRRVECQLHDYVCTFYLPVTIKPSPIAELFYGSRASDFYVIEDLRQRGLNRHNQIGIKIYKEGVYIITME